MVGDNGFLGSFSVGSLLLFIAAGGLLMNVEVSCIKGRIAPLGPGKVVDNFLVVVEDCHVGKFVLDGLEEFNMVKTEIGLVVVGVHVAGDIHHLCREFLLIFRVSSFWGSGYSIVIMGVWLIGRFVFGGSKLRQERLRHGG